MRVAVLTKINTTGQVWWYLLRVSTVREAEAGGSFEPRTEVNPSNTLRCSCLNQTNTIHEEAEVKALELKMVSELLLPERKQRLELPGRGTPWKNLEM